MPCPRDEGAVARDFKCSAAWAGGDQGSVEHFLVIHFAGDFVSFLNDAVYRRAADCLRFDFVHPEYLLDPVDVPLGFGEMGLERLLQLRAGRLLGHLGQRFQELLLSVKDVAQLVHEQVIECVDLFGKNAHGCISLASVYGGSLRDGSD